MIVTVTLNPAWDLRVYYAHDGTVADQTGEAGGKGINVARVLTGLGTPCMAAAWLAGNTGRMVEARLKMDGILVQAFPGQGETRTNIKHIELATGDTTEENRPGQPRGHDPEAAFFDWLPTVVRTGDAVALCGSLPAGVPPTIYADMIARLKAAGIRTVLDASGDALKHGAMSAPALNKPNEAEFCEWLEREPEDHAAFQKAVREAADKTGSNLLVTRGEKSAFLCAEGVCYEAVCDPVNSAGTTGAGDACLAAFLAAEADGLNPPDCLRFAIGAAACFVSGCAISRESVAPFAERVQVNRLPQAVPDC